MERRRKGSLRGETRSGVVRGEMKPPGGKSFTVASQPFYVFVKVNKQLVPGGQTPQLHNSG